MIGEKTLRQWRRDALRPWMKESQDITADLVKREEEQRQRILRLTAELLDQHLMKR